LIVNRTGQNHCAAVLAAEFPLLASAVQGQGFGERIVTSRRAEGASLDRAKGNIW
jgi:hypothetical protein